MKRASSIFIAAVLVRAGILAYMLHLRPAADIWELNEEGVIAGWLVLNHSFSSPFHGASTATAWVAPGYPFLVAVVFRFFGIASTASAWIVVALNALFSSLAAIVIYLIGSRVFDRATGLLAGWAWACSPYVALLPGLIWETSLSALLMSYSLWRILVLEDSRRLWDWICAGLSWGIAALVNPALLAPFPFLLVYLGYNGGRERKHEWKNAVVLGAVFAVVLAPWTLRNEFVFHKLFFVRSNAWAEIYFANVGFALHPRGQSWNYQRMGELEYVTQMKRLAVDYIQQHPGEFLRATLHRMLSFWIVPEYLIVYTTALAVLSLLGLVLAFREQRWRLLPFIFVLGAYPLTYYISHTLARFRHPIEPFMFVLSAYAGRRILAGRNKDCRPGQAPSPC